jgi:hypothetical protein
MEKTGHLHAPTALPLRKTPYITVDLDAAEQSNLDSSVVQPRLVSKPNKPSRLFRILYIRPVFTKKNVRPEYRKLWTSFNFIIEMSLSLRFDWIPLFL